MNPLCTDADRLTSRVRKTVLAYKVFQDQILLWSEAIWLGVAIQQGLPLLTEGAVPRKFLSVSKTAPPKFPKFAPTKLTFLLAYICHQALVSAEVTCTLKKNFCWPKTASINLWYSTTLALREVKRNCFEI